MDFSWSGRLFGRQGVSYFYVLCRYDYVEIHDGNSESADLLGKHCSNIAPAPIISSGPSLHIKFVSDYAHQGAGFSLRYEIFKTGKLSRYCYWSQDFINTHNCTDDKMKFGWGGEGHWVWHVTEVFELKNVPVNNTAVWPLLAPQCLYVKGKTHVKYPEHTKLHREKNFRGNAPLQIGH